MPLMRGRRKSALADAIGGAAKMIPIRIWSITRPETKTFRKIVQRGDERLGFMYLSLKIGKVASWLSQKTKPMIGTPASHRSFEAGL
jgi:hypothetical protein